MAWLKTTSRMTNIAKNGGARVRAKPLLPSSLCPRDGAPQTQTQTQTQVQVQVQVQVQAFKPSSLQAFLPSCLRRFSASFLTTSLRSRALAPDNHPLKSLFPLSPKTSRLVRPRFDAQNLALIRIDPSSEKIRFAPMRGTPSLCHKAR